MNLPSDYALEGDDEAYPTFQVGPDLDRRAFAQMLVDRYRAKVMFISSMVPFVSAVMKRTDVLEVAAQDNIQYAWHTPHVKTQGERTCGRTTFGGLALSYERPPCPRYPTTGGHPIPLGPLGLELTGGSEATVPITDVRSALGVEKSGGKAIDVGIVDSGVSTVLQRWVVFSESFVDSRPLHDELGHGTGVASAIIAINPLVRIHSVKVFTTGEGDVAHAMEALELLAHRGVKIINASWGSDAYPPVDMLVNELRAQGIAVVCAAGNSGPGPGTIVSPGAASGAITVGSITLEDPAYGVVSSFSARGPTYMGEIKPDLVAFGGGSLECIELADTDGTTTCWRGTSFAAPEIASLLSLVWDGNVETSYQRLVTAAGQPKNNDIGYGLPVLNSGPHQVGAEAESGPNTAMATLAIAALLGLATFAASRAGMGGGGRPSPTR